MGNDEWLCMVWFYINEHSISTRFTTNVMRIWLPQSTATEGFYLDYGGAKNWYIVCQHCSSIKYKYLLLHPTSIFHKFDGVAVVPGSGPGGILGSDLSRQPGSLLAQPLLQRGSEAVVGMRSTSRPAPQPSQPPLSQPQHHHQSCGCGCCCCCCCYLGWGPAPQPPLSLLKCLNMTTSAPVNAMQSWGRKQILYWWRLILIVLLEICFMEQTH